MIKANKNRILGIPGKRPRPAEKKEDTLGIVFLVFLVFYAFRTLQGGIRYQALGDIRLELLLGLVAAVPGVALLFGPRKWCLPTCFWLGLSLTGLMLIMVPFSVAPDVSWKTFSDHAFKDMLIGICITTLIPTPRHLRWFVSTHILAYAKMAQEGVLGVITGSLIWENQGTPRLHGSTPNYTHPNSFSGTQAGTIPLLAGIIKITRRNLLKLAMAAQIAGALIIIVYAGSRTTYVGFGAWLLTVAWTSKQKIKTIAVLIIAVSAASFVVPHAYVERFQQIFSQKDKEGESIVLRKQITSDAITIFLENPLGIGTGAFPAARAARFGRVQDTHNLYLEVATNLGIQGFIIFTSLLASIAITLRGLRSKQQMLIRRLSTQNDEGGRLLDELTFVSMTTSALLSFLLIRVVLGIFGHDLYEIYWWFAIGLTGALNRITVDFEDRLQTKPPSTPTRNPG